ncbi:hypothetical protein [Ruegeria halocynthiae]|uniref:hypothetical protein n=1 Tax=Ruegeria halocynthiae TaxID=985054 RepID=UPI00056488CB|nr:hypothetical protein [Ruegeria halocynthiae]
MIEDGDYPGLWDSFYDGLDEGMYSFGFTFPFLMVYLIAWFGTIIWIPMAIRLARKHVVKPTQEILGNMREQPHEGENQQ